MAAAGEDDGTGRTTARKRRYSGQKLLLPAVVLPCGDAADKRGRDMQDLIDSISRIEEATVAVQKSAEEEKKRIEAEMKAKQQAFDEALEEETQKKLAEIQAKAKAAVEAEIKKQQTAAEQEEERLTELFEKQHAKWSEEIARKVIGG